MLAAAALVAATLVLIAVPIARAAGGSGPLSTAPTAATGPVANDAAYQPKIVGRLSDARSVSGDGIHVRGVVTHAGTGPATVRLAVRRSGARGWHKAVATKVRPGKRFTLGWKGGHPGRYLTRLTVSKYGKSDSTHLGSAYVFRKTFASYYGPGLYGGGLACGGRLTPSTVGVANKTLPCGTKVTFNVGNRTVTARVIDRGPYVAGRDWDLTTALKNKLHFGSTGSVNTTR